MYIQNKIKIVRFHKPLKIIHYARSHTHTHTAYVNSNILHNKTYRIISKEINSQQPFKFKLKTFWVECELFNSFHFIAFSHVYSLMCEERMRRAMKIKLTWVCFLLFIITGEEEWRIFREYKICSVNLED